MRTEKRVDRLTACEVVCAAYPLLRKTIAGFQQEVVKGLCQYLVSRGMFPVLPRLLGHIPREDYNRIMRMVEVVKTAYQAEMYRSLLDFLTGRSPLKIPEPELTEFYESIYKMLQPHPSTYSGDTPKSPDFLSEGEEPEEKL